MFSYKSPKVHLWCPVMLPSSVDLCCPVLLPSSVDLCCPVLLIYDAQFCWSLVPSYVAQFCWSMMPSSVDLCCPVLLIYDAQLWLHAGRPLGLWRLENSWHEAAARPPMQWVGQTHTYVGMLQIFWLFIFPAPVSRQSLMITSQYQCNSSWYDMLILCML